MKSSVCHAFYAAVIAMLSILSSCGSGSNIPEGVYELPADEHLEVESAPGHLVIVDFHAEWCQPCKRFTPIFEDAAKTYAGKVQFVSVDVDLHRQLADSLQISSIPAVLFIRPDGQRDWHIGFMPAEEFDSSIQEVLK